MPRYVNPMTPDLLRQRRNLLLVSALLLFKKFAGVTISSVSVLGTSFEFGRPEAIDVALWILWVYALIRFAQYFWEDGLPELVKARTSISNERFIAELRAVVEAEDKQIQGTCTYDALHKTGFFKRTFRGTVYGPEIGSERSVDVSIPFRIWARDRLRTYGRLLIHTSVTDYLLLWLVAIVVFLYNVIPWIVERLAT